MGKIISFAGRLQSGKTELSKICENYGYKKLYFALPLKQLCADILDVSIDALNQAKKDNTSIQLTINDDICDILSNETNIPLETTKNICNGKYIETVRDMLQFIGTDYIRKYNEDWHVNKIKEMIDENTDYVIDDVRFQNEKKMIDELGGDTWFVIRPTLQNVSNHISETSITWQQCYNKVIINDSTLDTLKFKWDVFMSNYEHSCKVREKEFRKILENGINNKIESFSMINLLMLSIHLFTYVPKEINKDDVQNITMNEDKTALINYKDETMEIIENPLLIEDLKQLL